MILKFPDLETLRLALTTGALPVAASQKPAVAGFDAEEQLWVETQARLSPTAQEELKRLGAQVARTSGAATTTAVASWLELLPLVPDNAPIDHLEQVPVLFELTTGEELTRLALEVLRLGNDRQGYRWLEEPGAKKGAGHALLRVVGPPYYSLLRAVDHRGQEGAPRAYLERAPRVWVEMGYTHPLVERVKAPDGQLLLLRSPNVWTTIDDAEFRDIYSIAEFPLPNQPAAWKEGDLKARLRVSPSLRAGGKPDDPELWVLRDDPVTELNRFVQNSDDQQLARLSFAVGQNGEQTTIVLRVRQSRLPPPVLVLKATGYRHYLKLPNLFLPVGTTLHPPLRRDQVRKLLADDPARVIWLSPSGDQPGAFVPESLPEDAFRPLTDWIDYVIDREEQQLQAWVQAASFDFEAFVCDEELPAKPRKPGDRERPRTPRGGPTVTGDPGPATEPAQKKNRDNTHLAAEDEILDALPAEPDELRVQLDELEGRFLSVEGSLDTPERLAMWPDLAVLNAALEQVEESGVCWMNALWFEDGPSAELAWRWFRTEASGVAARDEEGPHARPWTAQAVANVRPHEVSGADLDRLLKYPEPTAADLRALAAYLTWAARRDPFPPALVDRLNPVQRFLEAHERLLPVRAVWLAWSGVARLSRGDALALARARDRLLERLFQNGLRPEQDLPGFLRFAGQPSNQRFRGVRQWMTNLAALAHAWIKERCVPKDIPTGSRPLTAAYMDLIFAYGLARLGEQDAARDFLNRAKPVLTGAESDKRDVHRMLFDAFAYRVGQALEGKGATGPLPAPFMRELEALGKDGNQNSRMASFIIDRLRQRSRILEPLQRIDPYRHWSARVGDLDKALAKLTDLTDRQQIAERVNKLLKDVARGARGNEPRVRILRSALDVAPRVGEEFARDMLGRVEAAYDALPEAGEPAALMPQAELLEKALMVAAHFDQVERIHALVDRFKALLRSQKDEKAVQALESLAGQCLRGLRKLGLRDKIDELLALMAEVILGGRDVKALEPKSLPNAPALLRALLHVAGGWYFFGRDRQAEPIVAAVRAALFAGDLPVKERRELTCLYAQTLGQAPVETAQKRLEELFTKLPGINDTFTTNTHYSLVQLEIVESSVLAIVSDDFTLGSNARRWLDDDEYLVRRRIHRELRELMAQA